MRLDYIRKVKNDYYVIVYRVLMYLYNCLRQDEVVDMKKLTPEYLHINQRYFEYIFDKVKKSVKGIAVIISDIPGL